MVSCSWELTSEIFNLLDVWLDSLDGLQSDLKASICIDKTSTEQARIYIHASSGFRNHKPSV